MTTLQDWDNNNLLIETSWGAKDGDEAGGFGRGSSPKSGNSSPKTPVRIHKGRKSQQPVAFAYRSPSGNLESFEINEHWMELFVAAIANPDVKWVSNYSILHYAVTKSNQTLLDYILESPDSPPQFKHYLHLIDDFGKKPADHAANAKGRISISKEPMFLTLQKAMERHPAPACGACYDAEKEAEYQDIKENGPIHKRKSQQLSDSENDGVVIDGSGRAVPIETGASQVDMTNIMTAYEVETEIPADYRKPFKTMSSGSWKSYAGKWPKDENLLHWAAKMGRTEICRYLVLVLNGDPQEENGKGQSAIQVAKTKRHRDLAKCLHTGIFPTEAASPRQKASLRKESLKKAGA